MNTKTESALDSFHGSSLSESSAAVRPHYPSTSCFIDEVGTVFHPDNGNTAPVRMDMFRQEDESLRSALYFMVGNHYLATEYISINPVRIDFPYCPNQNQTETRLLVSGRSPECSYCLLRFMEQQ